MCWWVSGGQVEVHWGMLLGQGESSLRYEAQQCTKRAGSRMPTRAFSGLSARARQVTQQARANERREPRPAFPPHVAATNTHRKVRARVQTSGVGAPGTLTRLSSGRGASLDCEPSAEQGTAQLGGIPEALRLSLVRNLALVETHELSPSDSLPRASNEASSCSREGSKSA